MQFSKSFSEVFSGTLRTLVPNLYLITFFHRATNLVRVFRRYFLELLGLLCPNVVAATKQQENSHTYSESFVNGGGGPLWYRSSCRQLL